MQVHLYTLKGLFTVQDYNLIEKTIIILKNREDIVIKWDDIRLIRNVAPTFSEIMLDEILGKYISGTKQLKKWVQSQYQLVYNDMGRGIMIPIKKDGKDR